MFFSIFDFFKRSRFCCLDLLHYELPSGSVRSRKDLVCLFGVFSSVPKSSPAGGPMPLLPSIAQQRRCIETVISIWEGKAAGPDSWKATEVMKLPPALLEKYVSFFNAIEAQGSWPDFLTAWKQTLIPKPGKPTTIPNLCPISVGNLWCRLWSSIPTRQLSDWLAVKVGPEIHGGIRKRGFNPCAPFRWRKPNHRVCACVSA